MIIFENQNIFMFSIKKTKQFYLAVLAAVLLSLAGCKSLITTYDAYSYTQLASLKVEVVNMMQKATDDYSNHAAEVEAVSVKLQKAFEYDTHKPKNAVMAKMWQFLYDALLSEDMEGIAGRQHKKGFFSNWRESKMKSPVFVEEARKSIIAPMFDLLLELESKKLKQSTAESIFAKIQQHLGGAQ